jgi:hypothetical protein
VHPVLPGSERWAEMNSQNEKFRPKLYMQDTNPLNLKMQVRFPSGTLLRRGAVGARPNSPNRAQAHERCFHFFLWQIQPSADQS